METKTVNRNIPADRENCNDRFRVKYNDKNFFQLLIVIITRIKTGETQSFSFLANKLPEKDSIHFSTAVVDNKMVIYWSGANPEKGEKIKETPQPIIKAKSKVKISATKKIPSGKGSAKSGFSPIAFKDSNVLVLGTMPGEQSLAKQEYYAHPRNLIWKIIASLVNEPIPDNYTDKKSLLQKTQVALWDVCDVCIREGSLDMAITNEVPNDLKAFLQKQKNIKTIAFNGGKAEALYDKYFKREPEYTYLSLPSSSPANAGISLDTKLKMWSKILL